ncbi:hypothetical protein F383_00222 [Gossypium arboreum]|uniref:Uncharacterized protein n=1 Tax=Gossypium arboreum TaxID=29729 RepID=A0A0B0PAX0_GOSAR|nr:hypothetical protein F383_00222 [Gossypium arboreum]
MPQLHVSSIVLSYVLKPPVIKQVC